MSIPVNCQRCGYRGLSQDIVFSDLIGVRIQGVGVPCPKCGGHANLQSGTYDFVGEVISAFRAPGMTREKLDAASQVVKEAATGAIVSDDALQQLSKISGQLAKIIERSDRTRIDWNLIFTILAMIYTIWVGHNSDNDAREALAESRTQTEINRKILEESRAQTALLRELTNETAKKSAVQVKRSALGNRAERRKSAAVERRSKGCRK